jgi:uncharacterized protein YybS (DUF2232 family)
VKNVRQLTEGAILLAVFAALLFITVYVPILGSILNFVLPLPFIMYSAKNNFKNITALFIAAIFISFIAGSLTGLILMLIYGFTGAVIGYLIQKGKSRTMIFISSSLTIMAGFVITYVVSVVFFKLDIIHEMGTALNQSLKSSEQMLKAMGQEEQIKPLLQQNANLLKMIEILAPSILILASILTSFLIQLVCFPIAKRFGVNVEPWGKIRNLSLPRSLLWYYLLAMGANILIHPSEHSYLYVVLTNAIYILDLFMVLQGLSFLFYFFYQKSVAKGLGVLIVILAFMIPIVHYIIMIIGITDLGFDFRKRFEKKE